MSYYCFMSYYDVSVAGDHTGRRLYTYEFDSKIEPGSVVVVPFANKQNYAIVRKVVKKPTFKTKKIVQTLPFTLPLKSQELLNWMEAFYPYDWGDLTKLFIPANPTTKSRIIPKESINSNPKTLPTKNKDQVAAYNQIITQKNTILHGVTGSGKTRVFLEIANDELAKGKNVLLLTPEIGLTPQLVKTFKEHCPHPVYVMHSQKTPAQRKAVWEAVQKNELPFIVIGPRSSLFLPYQNLGLIVADESHDQSYKNMSSPRYNGIYVASKLAQIHGARFLQSTATPNITDYIIYQQKTLPINTMNQVAAGVANLNGQIVDLTNKDNFSKNRYFSDLLIEAVNEALQKNEQALIFLNRRGSARVVQCNSCGHTEECPNCGVPITYHHDIYKLTCHICNYSQKANSTCSSCGSADLLFLSPGTKGIEQEITSLFPSAKIARFDLDTANKDSLKNRYEQILNGEVDIILGTQIISKGLDLPKLSVVGVLNADSALQLPDYKAEETAFQQLYQVTGRVGRGHSKGRFILQTRQPEHPIIKAALNRDYNEFFEYESHKRKAFDYPPYSNLALIKITKSKDATAKNSALKIAKDLSSNAKLTILGPSPSFYHQMDGKYAWQIVIKSKHRSEIIRATSALPSEWNVDIDPINLL